MSVLKELVTPFHPQIPWISGNLQTLKNYLMPPPLLPPGVMKSRLQTTVSDGTGDVVYSRLLTTEAYDANKPLIVCAHGITGDEDSFYLTATARHFLPKGHGILQINLRGSGPSKGHCRLRYRSGASIEIADILKAIPEKWTQGGIILLGISMGGCVMTHALTSRLPLPIIGGVMVSMPLNLVTTAYKIMKFGNGFYHRQILAWLKEEIDDPIYGFEPEHAALIQKAKTVVHFDDLAIAPMHGFHGAYDYYRQAQALNYVQDVQYPTLLVHAYDDPWICPYPYFDLKRHSPDNVQVLLSRKGGHVGFHCRKTHIWYNHCLEHFMSHYGHAETESFESSFFPSAS